MNTHIARQRFLFLPFNTEHFLLSNIELYLSYDHKQASYFFDFTAVIGRFVPMW